MIVDSSVGNDGEPIALSYLQGLGVDPATQVSLVVATHWHDDHVRGLASLVARCPKARFACSAALAAREIIERIGERRSMSRPAARVTSGVDEIRRTLEVLAQSTDRPAPMWASEGRVLLHRDAPMPASVLALSPSDRAMTDAHRDVSALVAAGELGRVPRPPIDAAAVALWVDVGDASLLLGSDLTDSTSGRRGWQAVIDSAARPVGRKAEIFKIPHHGAADGFNRRVWDEMVAPNAHAVVSPWAIGAKVLPSEEDLVRLSEVTSQIHVTSLAHAHLFERSGRLVRDASSLIGRVTLRRHVGSTGGWSVVHTPPATALVPIGHRG